MLKDRPVDEDDLGGSDSSGDDSTRTESQREWATWSDSGYRKVFQPRSVLRVEFFVVVLLVAVVIGLIWAAKQHP